jgi:GNAT superfamily N-acetyltransferase
LAANPPGVDGVPSLRIAPITLEQTRPLRQAVLRPHQTIDELAAHESPASYAVGAFSGDELIAVGLISPDGHDGSWRVRGMATAPHARGAGAGTAILEALLEHAVERGADRVWCNARTPARTLYERAGFRVASAEFELPEIGPHLVMELRHPTSAPTRSGAAT